MPVSIVIEKGRVPVKIFTDAIERQALEQLIDISQLPIIHGHVAAMPDVHAGIGATVGSVIATKKAIIPAAVGVDIGCGMVAVRLSLRAEQLPDSLRELRSAIERKVPVGFGMHDHRARRYQACRPLHKPLDAIRAKHPELEKFKKDISHDWVHQMGSLGGGNHFIELCLDDTGQVWIMLHSGSRGIGNVIGRYFIELAKREMERLDRRLPHQDLAYLEEGTEHFDDYVEALTWAQEYARVNRAEMLNLVTEALQEAVDFPPFTVMDEAVNVHHNYAQKELHFGESVWVTRKGAIRAGKGELGIIPGSMGQRSYIVRGKGNAESFCSCSHGAGRRMSRGEAKRRFTVADLEVQTAGVECRKDAGVIDEAPGCYKDIDVVMSHQTDLVEVVHTLKQVLCIKG